MLTFYKAIHGAMHNPPSDHAGEGAKATEQHKTGAAEAPLVPPVP